MKRKIKRFLNGFTLVEVLIALTIAAILSVVGVAIFSTFEAQARDSQRRAEIQQIATTLEVHYLANPTEEKPIVCPQSMPIIALQNPGYCPLQDQWFVVQGTGQTVPKDPSGGVYCMKTGDGNTTFPTSLTSWSNRAVCPSGWFEVSTGKPNSSTGVFPFQNFQICAHMETTTEIFCRSNQQR